MAGNLSTGFSFPSGHKITKLEIDGESVRNLMMEFNIYEDLSQNVITADLQLMDSFNLISNMPITEGMLVEYEGTNIPEDTNNPEAGTIKHKFEVIKVTGRGTIKQDLQVYNIKLASSGWSDNARTRISRAYKQKKYSEVVQDVFDSKFQKTGGLDGELDNKPIEVEDTEGMFNLVIPRWKPLTIFNWLATRSMKGKACNFLFWEDHESFYFKSVEKLLSQSPVAEYVQQTQNISESNDTSYYNFEEVNYKDTTDILFYGMNGMLGNRMVEIDFHKKHITDYFPTAKNGGCVSIEKEFSYIEDFGGLSHTDSEPLVDSDIADSFSKEPGNARLTVVPKHSKIYDDMEHWKNEKWMRQRVSQKSALSYLGLHVWATGSFKRKVGDVITFNMNSPESERKKDERLSGNYLVKAIRRKFDQDKYVMVMELVKDSYPT